MGLAGERRNVSMEIQSQTYNTFLSKEQNEIFMVVNCVCLSSLVALFGIVSNVVNMVVFCKQGLDSSINITFFALAISDVCCLIVQLWFNVLINPLLERADTAIVPFEFQYITGSAPRVAFSRITCLITVYITMERCLCITFPLHVKEMITPRRTVIAMVVIYCFNIAAVAPLYFTISIGWKFYPTINRTRLGLILATDKELLAQNVYMVSAFIGLTFFVCVVIFTLILIQQLGQKLKWRKLANRVQMKSETITNRDRKTINMVVLIASILIMCYTPGVILLSVMFFEAEFSVLGRYTNLFFSLWSLALLSETVNSSVNIFLYLKMSTKYKETFQALFSCSLK